MFTSRNNEPVKLGASIAGNIEEIESAIDSDSDGGIRFTDEGKEVTASVTENQPQYTWPTYEEDEDEDSDGVGHPEFTPPKRKKKRATRMRSAERRRTKDKKSPAKVDHSDSSSSDERSSSKSPLRGTSTNNSAQKRRNSSSAFVSSVGTRSDLESSYSDQSPSRSYDEVEEVASDRDYKDESSNRRKRREGGDTRARSKEGEKEITLVGLKDAFKDSKPRHGRDHDSLSGFADNSRLVQVLRYTLGASELADRVQKLGISTISWSTLLRVSQPYLDRNYEKADDDVSPTRGNPFVSSSGLASVEESETETEAEESDLDVAGRNRRRKSSLASLALDSDIDEGADYSSDDRSERGKDQQRRVLSSPSRNGNSKSPTRRGKADRLDSLKEESIRQLDGLRASSDDGDEGDQGPRKSSVLSLSTNLSYSRSSIIQEESEEDEEEMVSTDARIHALKNMSKDLYSPKKAAASAAAASSSTPNRTTLLSDRTPPSSFRVDVNIGRKIDVPSSPAVVLSAAVDKHYQEEDDSSSLPTPQVTYADPYIYDDDDARFPTVAPPSAKPPLPPTKAIPPEYMHLLAQSEQEHQHQQHTQTQAYAQNQVQSLSQPPVVLQPRRSSRADPDPDPDPLPPRPAPQTIASSQQQQPTGYKSSATQLQATALQVPSDIGARRSVSWSSAGQEKPAAAPTTPDNSSARRAGGLKVTTSVSASTGALSPMSPSTALYLQHQAQQQKAAERLFSLPHLSDYALKTGVVFEGWLKKKSMHTGFWQKRYCILAESKEHLFVMKIFYKAAESAWGTMPMQQKTEIPIEKFCGVAASSVKMSKGKEFTLTFKKKIFEVQPGQTQQQQQHQRPRDRRNFDASVYSSDPEGAAARGQGTGQGQGQGKQGEGQGQGQGEGEYKNENTGTGTTGFDESFKKTMVFKASDVQMRMIWVAMFERAIEALYEED